MHESLETLFFIFCVLCFRSSIHLQYTFNTFYFKLIVLDRLIELREIVTNEKVLQELVMDILRVLSTPDYDVRKKILHLGICLKDSKYNHFVFLST